MKKLILLHSSSLLYYLIHLLTLAQPALADLTAEATALLHFAAAVPHGRRLNWADPNSTSSICGSWVGITCSTDRTKVHALRLPGFGLYGSIPPDTLGKLTGLRTLSLHSNRLTSEIPGDVLAIPSLRSAYLHRNEFSGELPPSFSPSLAVVDLSFNALRGKIPDAAALPRLSRLNLSYNSLDGSIPPFLSKFPASSFIGNERLCGPPLGHCAENSPSPSPENSSSPREKRSLKMVVGLAVGGGVLALVVLTLCTALFCLKKRGGGEVGTTVIVSKAGNVVGKNENLKSEDFGSGVQGSERNKLVFFEGSSLSFDLEDLLRASAEVLGKGSYGTAYKAVLDESTTVVVKRLRESGTQKKEFEQQMEVVNRVGRRGNVVGLIAYYFSKDEKLLVYEYMPSGSLSAALHGNAGTGKSRLDWETRLGISLGAAKGLAHIHSEEGDGDGDGSSGLVHGNVKSSNVLLDSNLDGSISDFGLTTMMSYVPPIKHRGPGYRAPEVIGTRKVTQKSDVYSFGVVLLEILTGKSPVAGAGYDDVVDLPRWVRSVVREEWTAEVFDGELVKYGGSTEEEMVQLLQIALACVAKVPDARPAMEEVVRMIEDVRMAADSNRVSSEDGGGRSRDSNGYGATPPPSS